MLVSVSTMPAGENLKEYVLQIDEFADFLHCDVCDGIYNQTMCFSPIIAKQINNMTTLPLDVHLMTTNATEIAKQYINAGANIITAQYESFSNKSEICEFIKTVKNLKALVGLSLEPNTQIDVLQPFLEQLDVILIMAVKTGASGQSFDKNVIRKIEQLTKLKDDFDFKIQVDGGVDGEIAKILKTMDVDIVVSGSYIYNSNCKKTAIGTLK